VIAFERAGSGPTLVLLHGGLQDRRVWRNQITALSDAFTVVACDLPGWGESSDLPEGVRFATYTNLVAGWIDGLGLDRPHVLGTFFGASVAIDLWDRYPELVSSLTLASAYAGWAGSFAPDVVEQLLEDALQASTRPPDDWVQRYAVGMLGPSAEADVVAELLTIMSESRPSSMRATAEAFAELDLNDVLPRIEVPTLIITGNANQAFLDEAARFHSEIPGSELTVIDGSGPQINMETPDRFNAEVRAFVERASGDT
jgi:pimeloyl-ACP methyl ester carboxylesterase